MKEEEKFKKESEYYIEVGLCLGKAFEVVFDNIVLCIFFVWCIHEKEIY